MLFFFPEFVYIPPQFTCGCDYLLCAVEGEQLQDCDQNHSQLSGRLCSFELTYFTLVGVVSSDVSRSSCTTFSRADGIVISMLFIADDLNLLLIRMYSLISFMVRPSGEIHVVLRLIK